MIQAVKYPYKEVDKASLSLLWSIANREGHDRRDLGLRYACPPEAVHQLFGFSSNQKPDTVQKLTVHLTDQQPVVFEEGQEDEALQRAVHKHTALTAWFELNRSEDCRWNSI